MNPQPSDDTMDEYGYVVNVDAAVFDDGEYLFIERSADEDHAAGQLAFPGGKLEASPETTDAIERTARREVVEEVGVEVGAVTYVCSATFEDDAGTSCLNVVTLCTHRSGEGHVRAPEEVAAVHWLSPDALCDRTDVPPYLLEYVARVEAVRQAERPD
ncbi:NUDIX hydrolase [Halovivax gelatinilyticus]|uniref:NUDIX hydrolase n=1 Tax=Halovivax gelatinilyticus TaxID=2961597 RepID=UPI0020CA66EF|nr:NUDIX domain-containing protein [Halovivax gelatinilyticus]